MAAAVSFLASVVNNAPGAASVNFTSFSLGTASSDRLIAVAVQSTGQAISSVTIAGIAATLLKTQANGGSHVEIWIAAVPTGTSGTVNVTTAATATSVYIGAWALTGALATAISTASSTTNGGTMTLASVPAGGLALAAGSCQQSGATSTWTFGGAGVTSDWDDHPASQYVLSGASKAYASAQTNLAVIDTFSASASPAFVAVSLDRIHNYSLTCAFGSFALSGQAITMKRTINLVCAYGSFALTGIAAVLHKGYHMTCAYGSFTLTGIAAALTRIAAPDSKFARRVTKASLYKTRTSDPTLEG